MKPLILSEYNWNKILIQLHNEYPPSVIAIREKTKRVLGFTSRSHRGWIDNPLYKQQMTEFEEIPGMPWLCPDKGWYETYIHLDFYSEPKRTFFLIKYGEYL